MSVIIKHNIAHVRLSLLSVAKISLKHCILYNATLARLSEEKLKIIIGHVTRSLFKIILYAAQGRCNQTGSFYSDCQQNATKQTYVSLLIIPACDKYRELEQRTYCASLYIPIWPRLTRTLKYKGYIYIE